jgi:riboflavin synthase
VVQGHVDGTATLLALDPITSASPESSDWRLKLELPAELAQFVVSQGSITVEGISLTVAALHGNTVEIAIIPHTYASTNLQSLKLGDALNIETDVLARYAVRREAVEAFTVTESYLLANGY